MKTRVKTATEIDAMRESGRMLAAVLRKVVAQVRPDISTKALADEASRELKSLGGTAAFLGHEGFPDVICISVNEAIVHGMPNESFLLHEGDIVGLDFGVTYRGMITDGAVSVGVGTRIKPEHRKLLEVTKDSLDAGIKAAYDGVQVGDISSVIEGVIRRAGKYGIPKELVGHGVGDYLWEEPNIANYGRAGTGPRLQAGMTVAIEPMVTLGTDQIRLLNDGWTIVTADHSWAAHFEHTILITEQGSEILTV